MTKLTTILGLLLASSCAYDQGLGCGYPYRCQGQPRAFWTDDAALAMPLRQAVARWTAATGVRLEVAPGGIPVRYVVDPTWTDREGASHDGACAVTVTVGFAEGPRYTQGIEVDSTPGSHGGTCPPVADQLLHELVHALSPYSEHSADGIFAEVVRGKSIDSAALESMCAGLPCDVFSPEEE